MTISPICASPSKINEVTPMRVKPAKGRAMRWPGTLRLLKYSGEDVPETAFWLRAKAKGDVVSAEDDPAEGEPDREDTPAAEIVTSTQDREAERGHGTVMGVEE